MSASGVDSGLAAFSSSRVESRWCGWLSLQASGCKMWRLEAATDQISLCAPIGPSIINSLMRCVPASNVQTYRCFRLAPNAF